MTSAGIVDWGLGRRVAGVVSRGEGDGAGLDAATARRTCDLALERVLAYTRLDPVTAVPPVETVTRGEWIESNLAELQELAAPLEARAASEISLPWPLAGLVRGGLGAASGVEAGVVVGYASRRVLGQYQVSLGPTAKPPRMLLLGGNLAGASRGSCVSSRTASCSGSRSTNRPTRSSSPPSRGFASTSPGWSGA